MATQTVEFPCATGQTVTAKLFSFGSDTQVASVSATEATNRKGLYSAAFTDVAAGAYRLIALNGASVPLAAWDVTLTLSTATFQVFEIGMTSSTISAVSGSVGSVGTNGITAAALATDAVDEIVDAVWDEILNGSTHNIAGSAGRRLRQLASVIVHSGTAQGAGTGNNQIQLDSGASSTNGAYDPSLVFIESGTGAGQCRLILQYDGTTKVATVDRDWRVNPDNTSEFVIVGDAGRESVNAGLAQAGTSTTITLNTNAASTDDAYNGQRVFIRSGTGQDQVALIEDYVGSTKVATIRTRTSNGQWATTPDTTSAYMIVPSLTWTISEIQSGLATAANQTIIIDGIGYTLAQVQGAVSSPQTSTPAYATSFNGSTYTVTHTGVTSTGVRGTAVRSKS